MNATAPARRRGRLPSPIRWPLVFAWWVVRLVLVGWGTLALYYRVPQAFGINVALAVAFVALGAWSLWRSPRLRSLAVFAVAYFVLFAWWSSIEPRQDREWRPEVARVARAVVDGDHVRIENVRDFSYRSRNDFDERWTVREVDVSHITGVDFQLSFWAMGPIGHTMLSFVFDNAPPLNVSIETRPEVGEGFDPLASLFKQFELVYVVGEERDIIRVRTAQRNEEVFMYHMRVSPAAAQRLFRVYVRRINELAARPEFYHLLSNSCTVNIVRYANVAGGTADELAQRLHEFDIRHLLNGWIDRYFYDQEMIDTSMSLSVLRVRSHVNDASNASPPDADYPARIRVGLPVPPPPAPG